MAKKNKLIKYEYINPSENANFEKLFASAQNQTFLTQYCIKNLAEAYKALELENAELRKNQQK